LSASRGNFNGEEKREYAGFERGVSRCRSLMIWKRGLAIARRAEFDVLNVESGVLERRKAAARFEVGAITPQTLGGIMALVDVPRGFEMFKGWK
jgi:hypothetical protein